MKTFTAIVALLGLGGFFTGQLLADVPATFKVSEFSFTRPADWKWIESQSRMRAAQLEVPSPDGEPGEVVFFYFGPGNGGGTKANVERWLSQFEEPRDKINPQVEEKTVAGHKITYVQAEGTYKSGMPGGPLTPKPNHALLGAIIEAESGSVFVRLTAPKDLAKSSIKTFRTMVESGPKK